MGLFGRKKNASSTLPVPQVLAPVPMPLSTLGLAPVDYWAEHFLLGAGLDPNEVSRLKSAYPTPVPPPNTDHTFDAGDPPNPWTFAMACAEQAVYDALHVYITTAGKFLSAEVAQEMYAGDGLEILVGVIVAREEPQYMSSVNELVDQKIRNSFDVFFVRMLSHYLEGAWPNGESFRTRLG